MKHWGYGFIGIALAIVITLFCIGCTEEKIVGDDDSGIMFVSVEKLHQDSADDQCLGNVMIWYTGKETVSTIWIQWAGFEWRYFPATGNQVTYTQTFRAGTQYLDLRAYAWNEKGDRVAEYPGAGQPSGLYIGCLGAEQPEDITLYIAYLTPELPECDKILLYWEGGESPFDVYRNGIPDNYEPVDGNRYGTVSAEMDSWYIRDSDGSQSNTVIWIPTGECF